jgi:chaperone required for assembly of F1-ATPase
VKRFYKNVTVEKRDGGYEVHLDGRVIKTPSKVTLLVKSKALAEAVRDEWLNQEGEIDLHHMHMTRLANTSIDRVRGREDDIRSEVLGFADTDLLCYRTDGPSLLVERQTKNWDPLLDWASESLGASLKTTVGIMPVKQDQSSISAIGKVLDTYSEFELAGLHCITGGLGSVILALAYMAGHTSIDELWDISQLDEKHQEDTWGQDNEATKMQEYKRSEVMTAAHFLELIK